MSLTHHLILIIACFLAGILNTVAGGGSFLTLPALLLTGLDARAANMTSTLALFPMQVNASLQGKHLLNNSEYQDHKILSPALLILLSLIGGAMGSWLLILTSSAFFAKIVPFLILIATLIFIYGSFFKSRKTLSPHKTPSRLFHSASQFLISIYGGYFGGGIGFLMLASLTMAGLDIRQANSLKNILATAMNFSAVFLFLFSKDIGYYQAFLGAIASLAGSYIGVKLLTRLNERFLRIAVSCLGIILTVAMFIRSST